MNTLYLNPTNTASRLDFIKIDTIELDSILQNIEFDHQQYVSLRIESPLVTSLDGMTRNLRASRNRHTRYSISSDSVNKILLDDEPEIQCANLVVSYTTSSSSNSETLYLKETTLFPKLKGIVSLCLLTFSPFVELRVNERRQKYTGALCGLGFYVWENEYTKPMYADNDIEYSFECEFDNDDIHRVEINIYFFLKLIF